MCGIIGISSNKSVSASIINSLKKLEYRGYDSAGIATLSDGEINELKSEGRVESLEQNFDLKNLKGNISGNLQYNGELAFDKRMKKYFVNSAYTSDISLKNIEFNYKNSPLLFNISEAECDFQDNKIIVSNSDFKISEIPKSCPAKI